MNTLSYSIKDLISILITLFFQAFPNSWNTTFNGNRYYSAARVHPPIMSAHTRTYQVCSEHS